MRNKKKILIFFLILSCFVLINHQYNLLKNKNQKIIKNINKPKIIYLGGSSWGCAFYIGCYQAMLEKWGNIDDILLYGNSAGALIALFMALKMPVKEVKDIYIEFAESAKNNGVFLKMSKYHTQIFNKILSNPDDYKKVNNKLHIGITTYPDKHLVVNNWNSNEELINDLHCSFHIPFYCTYNAKIDNKKVLDGALSVDLGNFPRNSILIGMNKMHDIYSNLTTKDCIYPLLSDKLENTIEDGYNKTINYSHFIHKKKLIVPLPIFWIFRFLEIPFTD
jgi:hypothetical protein